MKLLSKLFFFDTLHAHHICYIFKDFKIFWIICIIPYIIFPIFFIDFSDVIHAMSDDTVLFVMGDHGMTKTGDHGGDSTDEVEAALFVYSPAKIVVERQVLFNMVIFAFFIEIVFINLYGKLPNKISHTVS